MMTDRWYILDGHAVKPAASLEEWARWSESNSRHVADQIISDIRVSTVFLGLDHSHGRGPPLVFETMIFGGPHDQWQERCSTWDEAEAMHSRAVDLVKRGGVLN